MVSGRKLRSGVVQFCYKVVHLNESSVSHKICSICLRLYTKLDPLAIRAYCGREIAACKLMQLKYKDQKTFKSIIKVSHLKT